MPVLLGGVAVSLAEKVEEALSRQAEKSGSSVEELVNEIARGARRMPPREVELAVEDVKRLVGKLRGLLA
jgi:hypothetical protein